MNTTTAPTIMEVHPSDCDQCHGVPPQDRRHHTYLCPTHITVA